MLGLSKVLMLLGCGAAFVGGVGPAPVMARSLELEDVLQTDRVESVRISPDESITAVVVRRGVSDQEAYGRTYYEIDPSKGDVWLISTANGEVQNLTQGASTGAGYWCATWSPDSRRLAMLSTHATDGESPARDNVRLYVWDRGSGAISRVSDRPIATQTRYGSPLYRFDLRSAASSHSAANRCLMGNENAPFVWLDSERILAVALDESGTSGLLDTSARPFRHAQETSERLESGVEPTVSISDSGVREAPSGQSAQLVAELLILNIASDTQLSVSEVPLYPFAGELTVSVGPDNEIAAILATMGALPPSDRAEDVPWPDSWWVQKRFGFLELREDSMVRWVRPADEYRYPLELLDWSPTGRKVALRGRASAQSLTTAVFVGSPANEELARVTPECLGSSSAAAGSQSAHAPSAIWLNDDYLLGYLEPVAEGPNCTNASATTEGLWLMSERGEATRFDVGESASSYQFRQSGEGETLAIHENEISTVEVLNGQPILRPQANFLEPIEIVFPDDPGMRAPSILVRSPTQAGASQIHLLDISDERVVTRSIEDRDLGRIAAVAPEHQYLVSISDTPEGTMVNEIALATNETKQTLAFNQHLADVEWGEQRIIEYESQSGQRLRAGVILPPDYQPGQSYPLIAWIYPGYQVESLENDYYLDPYQPGIYNLSLYAAQGYIVLVPSIPGTWRNGESELFRAIPGAVLPAIDAAINEGFADPDRLAVLGQSLGGYGVYALLAQTDRFRAGAAIAGITDLTSFYGQFDMSARGYAGIEHEKSANWLIVRQFGMPPHPYDDFDRYWRNSPLAYVEEVSTPLLLAHGEHDNRASMSQAEEFFYSLYQQGKRARLLRYWGENHAIAQSPANVRHLFGEIINWFDNHLGHR